MGIKSAGHSGQKRIYSILDRATRKFHGDLGLWMQYLDYAKRQKSHKKVAQIFTSILRLHPTKPELWIMATRYSIDDQGDMVGARSYMQRGLRFCKQSKQMWLEYARLELNYMAKITARQRILGLDSKSQGDALTVDTQIEGADHIALPAITAEDMEPGLANDESIQNFLKKLNSSPALSGAIPIAIFDAAMDVFQDVDFAEQFFILVAKFGSLPCSGPVTKHIADAMDHLDWSNPASISCCIRQPLIGISYTAPDFPIALIPALKHLRKALDAEPSLNLLVKVSDWLFSYLAEKDLDPDIRTAVKASVDRIIRQHRKLLQKQAESISSDNNADLRRKIKSLLADPT
jgi:U3 small nucleolar RNA-associated protein 6